jgi:ubiquinone/menaquinone biosynthesis C-methylase UbiE
MRKQLVSKAEGVVLETAIGFNLNLDYYNLAKIKQLFGCDWVDMCLKEAEKKCPDKLTLFNCDIHKMPFNDNSFDTVIDTFGLECTYDIQKSFAEMKRLAKPGGKILLLERGKGYWLIDNFKMMQKTSVNISARG